ncbi:hypothetical protein BDR06DRAFT_979763 [Suillus hirtellus]|nr:hypothetical protein BDR06DRAFT_979763 [Suillus hirtellus]
MGWTDEDLDGLHCMVRLQDAQDAMALCTELSGVVPLVHDMCINTCLAFTGPFIDLDQCPREKFDTYPIGPQLQALWWHPDHTEKMHWCEQHTQEILEVLGMTDRIPDVYEDLYESKQLDCWIYIWVLFDHSPDKHYQKKYVLPGGIIHGSKKPKNLDSFIFPRLHHLCAIQAESLPIWDGALHRLFTSNPFLFVATADGPGMAFLTGLVGHYSKMSCRLYCAPIYYPVLRQPISNHNHSDILIHQLPPTGSFNYKANLHCIISCRNAAEYEFVHLETGITKPSIFCIFHSDHILLVPHSFNSDIMHVATINAGDLLIPLWRGTFRADPTNDKATWHWAVLIKETWRKHGLSIADVTPYLPESFDYPHQNPAEKIHSGYKAWEWLLHLYGMGPATLYGILSEPYCATMIGFISFTHVHSLTHIGPEMVNKGPPICSSQWTMERTIRSFDLKRTAHMVWPCKAQAIVRFLANDSGIEIPSAPPITKWACLHLSNGQVARSAWKENTMTKQPRMAHNVKTAISEVYYYFNITIHNHRRTFAMVLVYSNPHQYLLHCSFHTVFACHHHGDNSLQLIEVCTIQSIVAMVLHQFPGINGILFYLIEQPGLDIITMSGINEEEIPDED